MCVRMYLLAVPIFACVLLFGCGSVVAQSQPMNCSAASSMQVNTSLINGSWYEVLRAPAPTPFKGCIQVLIYELPDNTTWTLNTTYADNSSMLYMNKTVSTNITALQPSTDGYNVTSGGQNVTLRVLDTDYTSYAFVCGFTNATDNSTSFGLVLSRSQTNSNALLNGYKNKLVANYTNFYNMSTITQTGCYRSSAALTPVPVFAAMLAFVYTLLKLLH